MNIKQIAFIDCLYTVSRIFLDVFLLAYLFTVTKQNIFDIGIYYFASTSIMLFTAVFIRNYLSKGYFLQIYRAGIFCNLIFFVFLLYMNKEVSQHMFLCGILLGLSIFLRGIARIFLTYQFVSESIMIKFRGYLEFVKALLKVVTPFIFGIVLYKYSNFKNVLVILFIMLFMEYFFTFSITQFKINKKAKTQLLYFFKNILNNKLIVKSLLMDFFRGMTILGVLPVVVTIYIVCLFETNFHLGVLTSVFSLITLSVNFLFGKYCRYVHFVSILKFSGIISVLLSFLFVLIPNNITFILYNLGLVTAMQLLWLLTEVNMFNIASLDEIKNKFQTEYFITREIFSGFGKILGMSVLIIIGYFKYFILLKYYLLLLTIAVLIMVFYAVKVNGTLFQK